MGISNVDAQGVYSDNGIRTQYGLILPPGSRVAAYVRSTGLQSGDDSFLAQNLVPTLAQGLARVRAGLGDVVVCLPGHVENVVDATTFSGALVAGAKIIGVGRGGNTPTFTWTAVGAQWAINKADVLIAGLRLVVDGANVTNAFNISANDVGFYYNEITASGGINFPANVMTVSGTAARYDITGNIVRTAVVGGSTATCILISSTGADGRVCDNEIQMSCSSANGIINITGVLAGLKILRNVLTNTANTSVSAITYTNAGASGQCAYNSITVFSTGAQVSGTTGITVGGAANTTGFFQNFVVNDVNKSGILQPAADT